MNGRSGIWLDAGILTFAASRAMLSLEEAMRICHLLFAPSVVLVVLLAPPRAAGQERPGLTADDKELFNRLMREFLFDPKGAERVSVRIVRRSVWGAAADAVDHAWYVASINGKPGQIYFTDGAWIPAPSTKEMQKVDFLGEAKRRYIGPNQAEGETKERPREVFDRMGRTAVGMLVDDDLAQAAWLYRFGAEDLAARALARARKGK